MAIVYVKDGKATIEDRYAIGFVTPILDDCQDWKLVSGEEVDGWTIVEFSRKIQATDTIQDRTIVAGIITLRLILILPNNTSFSSFLCFILFAFFSFLF